MTTKRVDPRAFVGKSFDMVAHCEHSGEFITGNCLQEHIDDDWAIKPRLDKAQVLDDYSWLPCGLVCKVDFCVFLPNDVVKFESKISTSDHIWLITAYGEGKILSLSIIGLHPDYEDQAKEWGYPVVEL